MNAQTRLLPATMPPNVFLLSHDLTLPLEGWAMGAGVRW